MSDPKTYRAPKIERFGQLAELTASGSGANQEGAGGVTGGQGTGQGPGTGGGNQSARRP